MAVERRTVAAARRRHGVACHLSFSGDADERRTKEYRKFFLAIFHCSGARYVHSPLFSKLVFFPHWSRRTRRLFRCFGLAN
jgi:hypothetical protein